MCMQCWWYQVLHTSHSANFTFYKRQEQWRSTHWLGVPDTNSSVLTNHWEAREATFYKQSAECRLIDLWSYLISHGLYDCKHAKNSELLVCLPTPTILCSARLNTRLAINFTILLEALEYMLSYTLTTPSSHPMFETVHQWQPPKIICTISPLRICKERPDLQDLAGRLCVGNLAGWATEQP